MPKSRIAARSAAAVAVASLAIAGALGAPAAFAGSAAPAAAGAKSVKKVTVKAVGKPPAAKTLLDRTVTLTSAAVTKEGHSCSGLSVAGALQLATKGAWGGTWDAQYSDFEVTKIAGLDLPFDAKSSADWYWSILVDGKEASAGVCEVDPKSGQTITFQAACYGKACPKTAKQANAGKALSDARERR